MGSAEPEVVKILFTYGSEKQAWIEELTARFNADAAQTVGGKRIVVEAVATGSGEVIEELIDERRKPHLISPASGVYIKLGNAQSQKKNKTDLVGSTRNLVRSPVVIAMWKPMAESLGWPKKPIGWSEILALSSEDKAWEKRGFPEWGPFTFGHTHPDLSNSGLISIFAEVYAAPGVGKTSGLTVEDVGKPAVAEFVGKVERSVVYYGSSTGFFAKKMFEGGPGYLSAAVLYENMVIESYDKNLYKPQFPVVAIYPKEGTFVSDHPVGIVERDWVKPAHREAAEKYIAFMLAPEQQKKAMTFGFRPGLENIDIASPIDSAHGVDPLEPKRTLQVPKVEVMEAIREVWQANRRQTSITLVFDTSGSMNDNDRMTNARLGAKTFAEKLSDRDFLSIVPFSTKVADIKGRLMMSRNGGDAKKFIDRLIPRGETALFDAIETAHGLAQDEANKSMIPCVIVLTDGMNNRSAKFATNLTAEQNKQVLKDLLERVKINPEKSPVRIFTIGYALNPKRREEAEAIEALRSIADVSEGKYYEGTPDNIEEIFREIRKFF